MFNKLFGIMESQKLVAGAISLASIGVGYGNIQLSNLANAVKDLNDTMITVVAKQGFSEKEIDKLEKRVEKNEKMILDLIKTNKN
jgi:predicted DNA-binding ArsR family transcriptional regulator